MGAVEPSERSQSRARGSKWECTPYNHELVQEVVAYMRQFETKNKWVCSSNGRVIPSQGIGNGIDARLIQSFLFLSSSSLFIQLLQRRSDNVLLCVLSDWILSVIWR